MAGKPSNINNNTVGSGTTPPEKFCGDDDEFVLESKGPGSVSTESGFNSLKTTRDNSSSESEISRRAVDASAREFNRAKPLKFANGFAIPAALKIGLVITVRISI